MQREIDTKEAQPIVLFPHCARTGGTTLGTAFREYYRYYRSLHLNESWKAWDVFRQLTPKQFESFECFYGHGIYVGIHRYIPRPTIYVGMFRDPVDRLISQYSQYRTEENHGMHSYIVDNDISLDQFQRDTPNLQSQYLFGFPHERKVMPTPNHFQEIQSIIDSSFVFTGVTSRYYESLYLMKKRLGWSHFPFFIRKNRNEKKIERETLADDLIARIEASNQLDRKVFEYVKQKLDSQLSELSPVELAEIAFLKQAGKVYGKMVESSDKSLSRTFLAKILQPQADSFVILSQLPQAAEMISNTIQSVNAALGRSVEVRIHESKEASRLVEGLEKDRESGAVERTSHFVLLPTPGDDPTLMQMAGDFGIPRTKLSFPVRPPKV